MPRTVLVGDVHGCRDELAALLERVGLTADDRLVMVGDLVVRGPDPAGTLDLLASVGARSVCGNHEDRLLAWWAGEGGRASRWGRERTGTEGAARGPDHRLASTAAGPSARVESASAGSPLGSTQRTTVRTLRKRHWAFLDALPLWIDLPSHGIRVVHAGVLPGLAIERQSPRTLMYMRCVDRFGVPDERRERPGRLLWGELYEGPPHVVFGHHARAEPQLHPFATGLDTGAVYGGRLTAMVLGDGQAPPPPADRRDALVSVPARRRYFGRERPGGP